MMEIGKQTMSNVTTRLARLLSKTGTLLATPHPIHKLISKVRGQRLTYLSDARLRSLARLCARNEALGRPGVILEAGCALGGSAIVMCAAKRREREMRIYDVFDMIPPPGEQDGDDVQARYEAIRSGKSEGLGGDTYYGYLQDLYERVRQSFHDFGMPPEQHNVQLIKGLLQDTLEVDRPVVLAHVDVDWYDPVKTCLERIYPHLIPGGCFVLDDYQDWSGCRKAADEFFDAHKGEFKFSSPAGALIATKL
jgi:O-methyltransferase